jgi:hypothetical protein
MPVTFQVAGHASKSWTQSNVTSREDHFAQTCPEEFAQSARIIQSSIPQSTFNESRITPSNNGFVKAAWEAYSQHHHLTIRPDDIWFAILSQLNFYINAHAEDLRDYFVAHEGKKELIIKDVGSINTVDFGLFARRMTGLIQQNVKDPNLRDWIMPTFSTTTVDDRTTAAVLMMGSLQAYFAYTSYLTCGIPSVTLLGERGDYEDILERLDKLDELGPEATDWAVLLRPILRKFIASFDDAKTAEVQEFWSKIAHWRGGSGISYLSGWLTAFCFWRNDGQSLYYEPPKFNSANTPNRVANTRGGKYQLDGVTYHSIDTHDIPSGFASVPVKVDDNGVVHRTKMVAGSLGINVTKSGERGEDGQEKWDNVRSLSGWLMYKLKEGAWHGEDEKDMEKVWEEDRYRDFDEDYL